jgi:hypothetical protein
MTGFPANNMFTQSRRPVPKFDMNLRDLFSEDETDKRSFSRISNQINSMRPPPPPQHIKQEQPQPQMPTFSTADTLRISPQLRTHQQSFAFDPSLQNPLPSPQHRHQPSFPPTTPTLSPPLSNPPITSPYQITNSLPYTAFSQQITSTYPDLGFSDLDFLDSFPVQGNNSANFPGGGDAGGNGGYQDLGLGMGGMGMGIGFGDGAHDWADGGAGLDLFDGFFFGPQPGQ